MSVPADWWRSFFTGVAVEMWLRCTPDEMTRREADFLEKALALPAGARVLDTPCGGGRHALELAARGHRVSAVDLSAEFLDAARVSAGRRGLSVDWRQADMRDLPWEGEFDGAYCLGNSFGYLGDEGDAAFVRAVARALKPGGRLAINSGAIAEALLPQLKDRLWYEIGDILFLVQNRYDHARGVLESELTFVQGGKLEKRPIAQRVYTYGEVVRLLAGAGLTAADGYGGTAFEPFRLGSAQLYLVATKAAR